MNLPLFVGASIVLACYGIIGEGQNGDSRLVEQRPSPLTKSTPLGADLDAISDSLALHRCDYNRSWYVHDRTYASLMISNPAISCAVWPSADKRSFAFSSSVQIQDETLPVVVYSPANMKKDSLPLIIVYIVGGPGGNISPGLNDALPERFTDRGALVVKLGYSGTQHGTDYPKPDFFKAASQIGDYVILLRRLMPRARIVLLGESLGGLIVAKSLSSTVSRSLSRVTLVYPLVFTPRQALANFDKNLGITPNTDRSLMVSSRINGRAVARQVKSIDFFRAFFPKESLDLSLLDYIHMSGDVQTTLVYGDLDRRVGNQLLTNVGRSEGRLRVVKLANVDHTIGASQASEIASIALHDIPIPE